MNNLPNSSAVDIDHRDDEILSNCECNEYFTTLSNMGTHDNTTTSQTLIAHRRPSTFWEIFFQQPIDLTKPFCVIWAGETSSDDGGPFREFLLHAMKI